MNTIPMLSVVSITYNHEPFIAKMIEGILLQQTTFPIELIIAEDCSTDRTLEIIKDYKLRYPELIKVVVSESNVGAVANERRAMLQSQGKYIAICEGDDYWTDPLKLQKQVEFLETNTEYSVCFHRCQFHDIETDSWKEDACGFLFNTSKNEGLDITSEMFFNSWITQPLSMVYLREAFDLNIALKYKHYRDMHLIYHLLKKGKGYLFAFDGGTYNVHAGGIHSKQNLKYQCENAVEIAQELYLKNKKDIILKNNYLKTLDWSIYSFVANHYDNKILYRYIYDHFYYSLSLKRFLKNCILIIKS